MTYLAPPQLISVITISTEQIDLLWNDLSNETSYTLFRDTDNDPAGAVKISRTADQTNYSNTGLAPDTIYYYWVKAYNGGGASGYSSVISNMTYPSPPQLISVITISTEQINLLWNDLSNETSYTLFRDTDNDPTGAVKFGLAANQTNYSDTGLVTNTTYYYWVKAFNAGGGSGYSAVESNKTWSSTTVPDVPAILGITAVSANQINIVWENVDNETSYTLFRNTADDTNTVENIAGFSTNVTNYNDTGLSADTVYYYWIKAYNNIGPSAYSAVGSAPTKKACEADLEKLIIGPSPFKPDDGNFATGTHTTGITFGRLTADALIEIYTVNGQLVEKLEEKDGDGKLVWIVPDKIASGVYICRVTNAKGDDKIKKIIIIK